MTAPDPAARPLLSFAIPTYQHGHALPDALESILASPRAAEVEIVVSNNASTDDTAEVIARYVARYPNVHGENQATNVTFDENLARAMDACTGRYIWTMSSDDVLTEAALSHVLDALAGLDEDTILIGNWWIADGDLHPTHLRRAVHADRRLTAVEEAVPTAGIWALFMSCLVLPADAARAELFRYRGGDGLTHWKIATRLAATGTPVIELGTPLVLQRMPEPVDPPYYDVPVVFSRNVRSHFRSLRSDVGLARGAARGAESRIIQLVIRGFAGTALQRWPTLGRRWFRPFLADYWTFPGFWLWIASLYVIPRPMLRGLWATYRYVRRRITISTLTPR